MIKTKLATEEEPCALCGGTGLAKVLRPAKPGHRIYPPNCKACGGKGRVKADGDAD
jgi:hypothetical protein